MSCQVPYKHLHTLTASSLKQVEVLLNVFNQGQNQYC